MNCRLRDIRNPRTALFDIFGFYWCWRKAVRDFQKFCGPGAVRNFDFFPAGETISELSIFQFTKLNSDQTV